jgi:ABC-type polysaccharide/polyol phosphate export permease
VSNGKIQLKVIWRELLLAKSTYLIWSYLSKSDVISRFRRSRLGLLWPILQQLSFSLGAGLIWAAVFNLKPEDFIPFLTLGFAIWGFIAAVMSEGCYCFVVAHGYLKQLPLSQSLFIFRTLYTQCIYLAIGFFTALALLLFFDKLTFIGLLISVPGLIILILYGYSAIGLMAYLGLRFRDLQHGLAGLFNLLFVVTPVIYPADVLIKKGFSVAIYGNPFASLIEVVRYPILNSEFADPIHYLISIIFVTLFLSLRFFIGSRWSRFVPFWS